MYWGCCIFICSGDSWEFWRCGVLVGSVFWWLCGCVWVVVRVWCVWFWLCCVLVWCVWGLGCWWCFLCVGWLWYGVVDFVWIVFVWFVDGSWWCWGRGCLLCRFSCVYLGWWWRWCVVVWCGGWYLVVLVGSCGFVGCVYWDVYVVVSLVG